MKRQHLYLFGVLLAVAAFAQEALEIKGAITGNTSQVALPGVSADQYNDGVPEQNTGY